MLILNLPVPQDLLVSVGNMIVARVEAVSLCSSQQSHLEFRINKKNLDLSIPLEGGIISSEDLQRQLDTLDKAMKGTVATYLGGLPGIMFPSVLLLIKLKVF